MYQELETSERAAWGNHNPQPDPSFWRNKPYWKGPPSASSLFSKSDSKPTCTYCKQPHSSNDCETVPIAQAQRDILKKTGRCYVCLRKDRLSRESNVNFFTCGGRHHVSICESNLLKTGTSKQCAKPEQRENVHPDQPKPDHSQLTMFISSATPILLQIAQAIIYKLGSIEKGAKARIVHHKLFEGWAKFTS